MSHRLLRDARLYVALTKVDQDLAEEVRSKGCSCGGRLHRSDYPRKPRGLPEDLEGSYRQRLSFCCDEDGCRARATPPSVRFLVAGFTSEPWSCWSLRWRKVRPPSGSADSVGSLVT